MSEKRSDLMERTRAFALRIVRLYSALPKTTEAQVLGKQVLRSGTSVGAHLREGKRSRSDAEMIRSEEHTSELQSHSFISYAVFCLKKKKKTIIINKFNIL